MKQVLTFFLTATFSTLLLHPIKSQNVTYKASVPVYRHYAKQFVVTDSKDEPFITVKDIKEGKTLTVRGEDATLIKGKTLKNSKGNVVATRKGKTITFPENSVVVKEVKKKKNWKYYHDDKVILEVNCKFNRATRMYDVEAVAFDQSELTDDLLKINFGRLDRYLWLEEPEWKTITTCVSSVVAVAIVAILMN
ncbi:MAG: hypothetical protein ACOX0M_01940 [Salinivirgaceae bacterium]|jgi:hypothetical protein|nr:hypothetical protein [Bacteroidales bacterium]